MPRTDISDYLIHFTKGETNEDAYFRLRQIIDSGKILGSHNLIKGGYNCVCFSEAPVQNLSGGLVNKNLYSKYSPFGVMVTKRYVYGVGGRPVIYQSDDEYFALNEAHKWRHVQYILSDAKDIDFTWEREWRVKADVF